VGRVEEKAFERRWWILFALCFSLLVIVLDNTILNVAIPTIVRELDATNSQLQWMVDSYVLVFAGLLLTAGALGDRFGRRPALQLGLVLFGIGSIASAYATSANALIGTRAFMGIGGAFIMPATLSIITNVFPAQERGKAIGVWAGTAGIAAALGPLIGGFLVEHFYWGSVFLVNVPIVIFGLIAGVFLIPDSKDPSAPRLDPIGAVLSIAGLTALLYAIIEAPNHGWTEPSTLIGFGLGLGLLLLFALWELHSTHPMLDMRLFQNARFSAASLSIGCVFFAMFGSIFLLTQYFQFILGYTPLQAGVRLLPFAAVMMVIAPSSAKFVERFGTKLVVASGLLCVAISLGTFGGLAATSPYWQSAWRMMLMALGMGLTMAPATESIMSALPLAKAGVGSAVNDTVRQVGGALGVAVIGSVYSSAYVAHITDSLAGSSLPPEAQTAAKDSIGGALGVAADGAQRGFGDFATQFAADAKDAFVVAMHRGVLVGAVVALLGAVMAYLWLPARARSQDVESQTAEFRAESRAPEPA
jgi:EmrB/QacA subfamily drug resistance transporter